MRFALPIVYDGDIEDRNVALIEALRKWEAVYTHCRFIGWFNDTIAILDSSA